MPLYTVWIGYKGYDVNALVKARNRRAARKALLDALEFDIKVTLVDDKLVEEQFDDEEDRERIERMRRAHDGKVYIYDEGT